MYIEFSINKYLAARILLIIHIHTEFVFKYFDCCVLLQQNRKWVGVPWWSIDKLNKWHLTQICEDNINKKRSILLQNLNWNWPSLLYRISDRIKSSTLVCDRWLESRLYMISMQKKTTRTSKIIILSFKKQVLSFWYSNKW
jgi:hypothetical protein